MGRFCHISLGRFCAVSAASLAAFLAVDAPAFTQTVTLDVEGEIVPSCELSGLTGSVTGLDLSIPGTSTLDYTVDCNAPFAYALESSNLAFKPTAPIELVAAGSSPFEAELPYTVTTSFLTDEGGSFGDLALSSTVLTEAYAAPCVGAAYSATCPFAESGTGVTANPSGNNASLQIDWGATALPLLGGTYQDTLTLTVRIK